jgi:hypothetical protein
LQAARDEGFAAVGIEREASYLPLIAHRLGEPPSSADTSQTTEGGNEGEGLW